MSVFHSKILFLLLICFSLMATNPISAQENVANPVAIEAPTDLNNDEIADLVSQLNADQVNALSELLALLANYASKDNSHSLDTPDTLATLGKWIQGFGDTVVGYVADTPAAIMSIGNVLASIFTHRSFAELIIFFALLVLTLALGAGSEWLFNRLLLKKREQILNSRPITLLDTLKTLSFRAMIEIGSLIIFVVIALIAAKIIFSDPFDLIIVTSILLKGILTFRLVSAILKFVLAPKRSELRLVYTDDWTAQYMYRNFAVLAGTIGVAFFTLVLLLYNEDHSTIGVFRFWISLLAHSIIIFVTWKARHGLTAIILGDDAKNLTSGLEKMATWWPPISMIIVAFNWFLIQFIISTGYQDITPAKGAIAVLLIVTMPFLDTIVRGVASHLAPVLTSDGKAVEKVQRNTRLCYVRIGRVILFFVMIVVIGKLWGINLREMAEDNIGGQFAANSVGFLLILAIGYMGWEITNMVISRKLVAELDAMGIEPDAETEGGEAGGAGLTRMATILPILRITIQVSIVILTIMLALSQLGVNIAPLLAGAGVLGLAIGFGGQTLVKDIVSGIFFLFDDAFRPGEYIDIGGTQGTVEKISIRSIQLRGTLGPIHIIPYGSMPQLTNMSRDWVIMKLKFTIPFDTDQEKVRKLFKKIGQEMMDDPELGPKFLAPFKGQGASDVTDTGIVVRGKFTTLPGDQWVIRKEIYKRVQQAFDQNGIEFARKEVHVRVSDSTTSNMSTQKKEQIAAAASDAVESVEKK